MQGSRHDFRSAHRDHESKAPASWSHSKRFAKFRDLEQDARAFGVRGACSRFCRRFMARANHFVRAENWSHRSGRRARSDATYLHLAPTRPEWRSEKSLPLCYATEYMFCDMKLNSSLPLSRLLNTPPHEPEGRAGCPHPAAEHAGHSGRSRRGEDTQPYPPLAVQGFKARSFVSENSHRDPLPSSDCMERKPGGVRPAHAGQRRRTRRALSSPLPKGRGSR